MPKRRFAKAHERNRIKRLMREAYRTSKHPLYRHLQQKETQMALMLLYTGKKLPDFELIQAETVNALVEVINSDETDTIHSR